MARLITLTTLLAITICISGCSSFPANVNQWNPLQKLDDAAELEQKTPLRMAIMWKDSVIHGVGRSPTVGFGGRVYFYNMNDETVEADGELTVYGYQEDNTTTAADKKFVFRQDEFKNHYDDGGLGASYGVWIPWEKTGGTRKSISLIPVFKTTDGRIIRGSQTLVVLPGKAPEKEMLAKTDITPNPSIHTDTGVMQANYAGEQGSQVMRAGGNAELTQKGRYPRIKSSTIKVPKDLGRRLTQTPAPTNQKPSGITKDDLREIENRFEERQLEKMMNPSDSGAKNPFDAPDSSFNAPTAKTTTQRPIFGQPGDFK